jgi:short-subunit dehydrogenase
MKQALVVGGTGMLAPVAVWLANNGYHVSVIGRSEERLNDLNGRIGDNKFTPIQADYTNKEELKKKLSAVIADSGTFNLIIAWVRTNAESSLAEIINLNSLTASNSPWVLLNVLGSTRNPVEVLNHFAFPKDCNCRQIQLAGF